MSELMAAALSYVDRGWHVVPLHTVDHNGRCSCNSPCRTPGKHPRTRNGLLDSSNQRDQVKEWWSQMPDSNIGIRTGKASDLWVLDIDNGRSMVSADGVIFPEGENTLRTLETMAGQSVPNTLTSMTGSGGRHLLFSYPRSGEYRNKVKVAPSIDVRGENGYIVAPPSLHASGKRYTWADADEPIAPAPTWLLNLQGQDDKPFEEKDIVSEGGRNDYLFRLAAKLVGEGRSSDEVANLVVGTNRRVCSPPLEDAEVMLIINSALKYEPNPEEAVIVFDKEEDEEPPVLRDGESIALSISEVFRNPPEKKQPLIEGGILDQGDGMIFAGASNVGKSWLAMDLATSLVLGDMWLGKFKCEPSRVLYVDEESSLASDYGRFQKIMTAHTMPSEVVMEGDLPLFLAVQKGVKIDTPKGRTILARMMSEYKPDVVIMDALVRMHTGEENSVKDMSSFFDTVNQLRRSYGCAFIFLHHIRKPSKEQEGDDADQMRGSSDIKGWPDTVLMVRENDHKDGMFVTHAKSRDHEKLERFEVGRVIDDDEAQFKYKQDDPFRMGTPEGKRDYIMHLVSNAGAVRVTDEYLAMKMGMSVGAVRGHTQVLMGAGMLAETKVTGQGTWYTLPNPHSQGAFDYDN